MAFWNKHKVTSNGELPSREAGYIELVEYHRFYARKGAGTRFIDVHERIAAVGLFLLCWLGATLLLSGGLMFMLYLLGLRDPLGDPDGFLQSARLMTGGCAVVFFFGGLKLFPFKRDPATKRIALNAANRDLEKMKFHREVGEIVDKVLVEQGLASAEDLEKFHQERSDRAFKEVLEHTHYVYKRAYS